MVEMVQDGKSEEGKNEEIKNPHLAKIVMFDGIYQRAYVRNEGFIATTFSQHDNHGCVYPPRNRGILYFLSQIPAQWNDYCKNESAQWLLGFEERQRTNQIQSNGVTVHS